MPIDPTLLKHLQDDDPTLTKLSLYQENLDDKDTEELAKALETNHALTILDLVSNKITGVGAQALGKALKSNRTTSTKASLLPRIFSLKSSVKVSEGNHTLRELSINNNQIGDVGAQALGKALETNYAITMLRLAQNKIGDEGAQALGKALETNTTLTNLDLYENQIADAGAQALGKGLETNHALTILGLCINKIWDWGAQALGNALQINATLTILDLGCNQISDAGAGGLGKGLETNHTLTTLDLRYNKHPWNKEIGDAGAQALGKALETNRALTMLDLSYSQVGDAGIQALSKALETNYILRTCSLWGSNKVGHAIITEFYKLVVRNETLAKPYQAAEEALREAQALITKKASSKEVIAAFTTAKTKAQEAIEKGYPPSATLLRQIEDALKKYLEKSVGEEKEQEKIALSTSISSLKASPVSAPISSSTASETKEMPLTLKSIDHSSIQSIAWKDLQVGDLIANGSFGDVYRGQWSGVSVAIKVLHLKTLTGDLADDFNHEAELMWQCQFLNIARLYGICTELGHFAMVMELLVGSLYHALHSKNSDLTWSVRLQIAIGVGKGLDYLHGKGILHRDLKSLNILLDEHYQVKISDFGLAKLKLETNSTTTKSHNPAGTVRWRAPELFKRKAVPTKAADIYSYGMVLWEIATSKLPFSDAADEATVITWVQQGEKEEDPSNCPQEYSDIIKSCWETPEKRPTAQEVVAALEKIYFEEKYTSDIEKSWHIDSTIKPPAEQTKGYALIPATAKDFQKVVEQYQHHPVPGYDIKSVEVIYNPALNRSFALSLSLLQKREGKPAFAPKWPKETINDEERDWRSKISAQLDTIAAPYIDSDYPAVKLLPLWHGTRPAVVESILETGYANLATTDSGYFGKGLYSAYEAEYAYRVYSKGSLIFNWVATFSAYPVIDGDMPKLMEKGNYQNYDAHFIPVVPANPNNPQETIYYPCAPKQKHEYTEAVVFDRSQCLPRYLVELQPSLPKSPSQIPLKHGQYPQLLLAASKNNTQQGEKDKTNELQNSQQLKTAP